MLNKTIIAVALSLGVAVPAALVAVPAHANEGTCVTEIKAIDTALETAQVEAETLSKVTALRESALSRAATGDEAGCMTDVGDIKALLKL